MQAAFFITQPLQVGPYSIRHSGKVADSLEAVALYVAQRGGAPEAEQAPYAFATRIRASFALRRRTARMIMVKLRALVSERLAAHRAGVPLSLQHLVEPLL